MCPICWISGFIAILFGGSFIATINHPISWIIGVLVILWGVYKFYEGYKRLSKMTDTTKDRNRKMVYRFVQGILVGIIITVAFFYNFTLHEDGHGHEQPTISSGHNDY